MGTDQAYATILLIDCSSRDAQSIHQMLEKEHFNVYFAKSITEALRVIQYISPDLILLNGGHLEGGAEDICRRLRNASTQYRHNLPLIFLQPINGSIPAEEEPLSGVDDYFLFPKPGEDPSVPLKDGREWNKIVYLSNQHLLSLLRGHLRIHNLETSVEESQRQLSRAQRIMDRELSETAKMQRSFLPHSFPEHPELELAAVYQPSIKVGGDYYDVIQVDDDHWGLVIADIAGHGSAAAVVMALTQMVVKEFGRGIVSPQEALFLFNRKLNANLSSDHYVTMFYAVLNLRTMELVYSHAGHVPLLFYRAAEQNILDLKTEPSFPLRTFEMESYEEQSVTLEPGDQILFFTDGVLDVQNTQNYFFGADQLKENFLRLQPTSVKNLVQKIFQRTETFRGQRERLDDFTLMALGRKHKTHA